MDHGLTVEQVPVSQLRTYHRNPRKGNVEIIAESLRVNGQYRAIAVNRGTHTGRPNEVLAGNHTLLAARNLGWDNIAATFVDVDDDQCARIVAVDNRSADLGEYDEGVLAALIGDLPTLDGTGYTADDLAALLGDADEDGTGGGRGQGEARRTLAERFGVPPFTLLDSRQGYWQTRKRAWIALGLRSEVGRSSELLKGFSQIGRMQARARGLDESSWEISGMTGVSIFDPVLCELLVRWYTVPGAAVLDPFAGGSVRGIVSACLGRRYTGVDLRPEQVEANRAQAEQILPGVRPPVATVDFTPELTPVERHGDQLVKRDDAWCRAGASGAKSRVMFALAEQGTAGIITAGARRSPQIERAALVAQALGIGCRVHVPDGADTPEIETCRTAGAEVLKHPNGRLTVLRARFRDDTAAHPDWLAVPFGMGSDAYAEDVAAQVANLPAEVTRIVVPCGSGMTTAGILRGLDRHGRADVRVSAVIVGHDPTEYLDRFAPAGWRDRVEFTEADTGFDEDAPVTTLGVLNLDPMYEAKCLPYLRPGDLLWCVGLRAAAPANPLPGAAAPTAPTPRWVVGDSRELREHVSDTELHDLLLTCPPYFDLEQYSDDPADLSRCADYDAFLRDYTACLAAATDRMRPNAFAALVTGAVRDKRGYVLDLPADTTRIMESLGWRLYQDAVLATVTATTAMRAGRQFAALRKLSRVHQMVGVYHRGDITAVRDWPPCEVGQADELNADQLAAEDSAET